MFESISIPRHPGGVGNNAFELLRRQGIEYAQRLSGRLWTDYNTHDPGVTILEQLCYALTDVMYRADFPVEDLLTGRNGEIRWRRQALLAPQDVFPCRPTTASDYRAIVLDQLRGEVEDAAVSALDEPCGGLYKVRLWLKAGANEALVRKRVRQVFAKARNLCEDLELIEVERSPGETDYAPRARVKISGEADPALILARIYSICGARLSRTARFQPLDRALNASQSPEEVFRGPFTGSGVIDKEGHHDVRATGPELLAGIQNDIPEMEGIEILTAGSEPLLSCQALASLDVLKSAPKIGVELVRGGATLAVTLAELKMRFEELNQAQMGRTFTPTQVETLLPLPQGRFHEMRDYLSAQFHFPPIYGLGEKQRLAGEAETSPTRVADSRELRRKALANQLKAYLLLFDQMMADYSVTAGRLRELYSLDFKTRQTKFTQTMSETQFPGVTELLGLPPESDSIQYGPVHRLADSGGSRSRRLLDYLLALYGESFRDDCCKYQAEARAVADPDFVAARLAYLEQIGTITRDRGSGADLTAAEQTRCGLEIKLSHLLGFESGNETGARVRVVEHLLLQRTSDNAFRISVLFSGWPEGCQDERFRTAAEELVYANCPAHIHAAILWLDEPAMENFEKCHEEWRLCAAWWSTEPHLQESEQGELAKQEMDSAAAAVLAHLHSFAKGGHG